MENDRERSLQSWEFRTLFLPRSWPEAIRADFEALEREDPAAAKAADLRRLYGKCGCVLRCYRDEAYGDLGNVLAVPLGYKTGFRKPPGGAARTNAWAFAGQGTKSSRRAMLGALGALPGTRASHVSEALDWDAPDNLATDAYARLLASAALAPCPVGWIHPDSFRLYEALECGCLPVVERPAYFAALLGDDLAGSLVAATAGWDAADVSRLAALLADGAALEARRARCAAAWAAKKVSLGRDVRAHLDRYL